VRTRKHSRSWEHDAQLHGTTHLGARPRVPPDISWLGNGYPCDVQVGTPDYGLDYRNDRQYSQELPGMPPRKRIHHAMIPGFDVMNGAPLQQNMTLQS